MAENSKIEWTRHTANLWHGCTKVHAGCDHCYAETLSKRWGNDVWGNDKPRKEIKSVFPDLYKYQEAAAKAGEMHRVFVGSMMDIFEKPMPLIDSKGVAYPFESFNTGHIRESLFMQITLGQFNNLMFLFLTKRPSNINKMIPEVWKATPPDNVMFGTSPVDQETTNKLVDQLLHVKGKRFLSIEPMLGPVDLSEFIMLTDNNGEDKRHGKAWFYNTWSGGFDGPGASDSLYAPESGIHWVIVGGESGPGRRPFNLDWARSLREQCADAEVPFFFKQIDKVIDKTTGIPADLMIREFPQYDLYN